MQNIHTQLAVVGGGSAGVTAAISSARLGIPTVLITDRPVLGGNSSSEIRVWTRGATGAGNLWAEEMGIWGMLKLENLPESGCQSSFLGRSFAGRRTSGTQPDTLAEHRDL